MKIKYYILPSLLAIAVLISIWLSSSIWTNPAHYQRTQGESNPTTQVDTKPISSVYAPTQVLETKESGKQYMLTNESVNLITAIGQQMHGYKDAQFKQLHNGDKNAYMRVLRMHNSIMLNYPSEINLKIVSDFVNSAFDKLPNVTINRIVIPFNDDNNIYVLGDKNYKIYRIHVKDTNTDGIESVINKNVRRLPASVKMLSGVPFINFNKGFKMPQYGYLINKTSQNYYVTRLLSDTQDISVKRHRNSTVYNDENSRQISFNNDGEVNYYDSHPGAISTNMTQFLSNSYKNISNIMTSESLANIRYFDYSNKNSMVVYRNYVEGFPIFDQTSYGAVQMKLVDNTSLKYNFSLNNLQIPVPTGRPNVKLENTDQVINKLKARGYQINKIHDIELGYQWTNTKSSDILITLEPTWFVNYNGKFMNYNQMLLKHA